MKKMCFAGAVRGAESGAGYGCSMQFGPQSGPLVFLFLITEKTPDFDECRLGPQVIHMPPGAFHRCSMMAKPSL